MEEYVLLNVDEIAPNPMRTRMSFSHESLMKLTDSIRKHGLLEPVLVASTPVGYQIIIGERRWRACKLAGLTQIPAIVRTVKPVEILLMSLTENMQKESLTVFEQGAAIQRLVSEFSMSLQEIGENLGIGVEELQKKIKLLELSDKVKNEILSRKITDREALDLVDKPTEKEVYQEVVKKTKRTF